MNKDFGNFTMTVGPVPNSTPGHVRVTVVHRPTSRCPMDCGMLALADERAYRQLFLNLMGRITACPRPSEDDANYPVGIREAYPQMMRAADQVYEDALAALRATD